MTKEIILPLHAWIFFSVEEDEKLLNVVMKIKEFNSCSEALRTVCMVHSKTSIMSALILGLVVFI